MKSIKTKFIILNLIIILVGIIATGTISYSIAEDSLIESTEKNNVPSFDRHNSSN